MRLTTVILIASLMQVSAATFGQRVTLNKANASLFSVLKDIRKQTGYGFYYDRATISQNQKVSISVADATVEEALSSALKGLNLVYEIDGKIVTIKAKEKPSFLENVIARFQEIDVSGRVVDAEGRGLPGASISVKGKGGKAVSTGANGSFYLKGVDEDAVLVISFIGYVPKEMKAAKELGDVALELSNSKLDEVQVIAYGTTTQRLSTGNVTTIKADVIEKQPVNNPLLALQGRVPGLFIEQATGIAGGGVKVRIQGQNSIRNGNDPLYVIDGVPYISQLLPTSATNTTNPPLRGGSPTSFINPADIESIDVLKDADATAIYGSRAANGAVLITTKKGKTGDVKVDVNLQSGFGKVGKQLDLLNTQQYLAMRHEALKNDNIPISSTDYDINGLWDTTRYTNWQKEFIGGMSKFQDFQGSVSGGSATTQFLFGAGYHKETAVFPGDFADTKGSGKLNVNSSSKNQKFKMQIGVSYLVDNNHLPNEDLTTYAIQTPPDAPALYNVDGSLNWSPDANGNRTFQNPIASYAYVKYNNKSANLMSNAYLSYQILSGLDLKSTFGYTNLQTNELNTFPQIASRPEYSAYNNRSAIWGNSRINSWIIEPQVTYNRLIGKGKLDVLIGTTLQHRNSHSLGIVGTQQISDAVLEDLKSAVVVNISSTLEETYKYNALFGRLNYIWNDKYVLNITARRDGSSRFGSANQFHNFGSVGAAWIFSEEKLLNDNVHFLSFGKLKASYGTTGSDQIGEYESLSSYNVINTTLPYQGSSSLVPSKLFNPYLGWEETRKLQIGIDLGFLKDRVLFNTTYSKNRSSNQLISYLLSRFTGFYDINSNMPAVVQNSGWEFTLSTINLISKNFKWTSSFNLTAQRNKLAAYPGLDQSSYANSYYIGKPLSVQKVFHSLGVDPETGVYYFEDKNGAPTFNPDDFVDRNVFINADPIFYGGLGNSFRYHSLEIDILFQFVKQKYYDNSLGIFPGLRGLNQPISVLSRWQNVGDQTDIQRFNSNFSLGNAWGKASQSDLNWVDASYIRLKNLSLSWELPNGIKKGLNLENCKLYLLGQNLVTITHYNGLDPETKSLNSLPPLKQLIFGIKIGL